MQNLRTLFADKKAILSIITVIAMIAVFLMITAFTNTDSEIYNQEQLEFFVIVVSGDTLWDIAREHNPKQKNVRKRVEEIIKYNNKSSADIYPGEKLFIPA